MAEVDTDRRLVSGIAWTAVFRWCAQALTWISTFYVARVLTPADYGLVAMAAVPIGFVRLMEDLGLDAIIVQDRTLDREQLAGLAGTVLGVGGILTASFLLLATSIAAYFREPAVAAVVAVMSAHFVLDAIQVLPSALLQREFRFRTLAAIGAFQTLTDAAVAVTLATRGWGHWALVFGLLAGNTVATVVMFVLRPYAISWPRRFSRLSHSLVSGWRMLVSRAAYYGYTTSDAMIIGRMLGKDELGAFRFAKTFASVPVTEVSSVVGKVVPGIFSAVQKSPEQLRRYFLMLTEGLSYITMPMSVGLMLTADVFVQVALGPQWAAAVLPLRVLGLYMIMNASQMLFAHVILWTGAYRAYMWLSVLSVVVVPPSIFIGSRWGLGGVAWAWVLSYPLTTIPALLVAHRILGLRAREFFAVLRPAATGCAVMVVVVMLVRFVLPADWPHAAKLASQASAGAATYATVMLVAFGPRVRVIYELIRGRRQAVEPVAEEQAS